MAAMGGPIQEASIKGRLFPVAADADAGRKLGGKENEIQMNGDGSARVVQTLVSWTLSGLTLSIDENRGDQQFLQDISDTGELVDIAVTFAGNTVYSGTGTITGELSFSSKNAVSSVAFGGPGKLEKQ